jgi:type IVB pilus formation R64 PilN family outer membrane protein
MKKISSLCTRLGLLLALGLLVSACDRNMPDTQAHLNKDSNKADELYNKTHKVIEQQSLISHSKDFYVATKSHQIEESVVLPHVFDQKIIYSSAKEEGITTILVDIYTQTGINFKFTPDAIGYMTGTSSASRPAASTPNTAGATSNRPSNSSAPVVLGEQTIQPGTSALTANVSVLSGVKLNLQYTGTFFEFVERIGTQFDLYWEYNAKTKTVEFYRTKSKVFALDLLPGITTFENNISSSSTVSGSGSGGGASTGVNLNSGAVMTVDYKNDQGNAWNDTVSTIQAMLSPEGTVNSNLRSGYVTVSDIPERVSRIESYINKINDKARKKIAVKVDVFDVLLTASTDYGIDWDAIIKEWGGQFAINSGPIASPLSTTGITDTIKFTYTGGGFLNTLDAIFKSLSKVGDTTRVIGTTVYTVNGEPAPVQVVKRQDYIQQITFSAVSQNSSTTEVAVTPGTVISGFFLVVTPTILSDSQILLNLSFSLSTADVTTNTTPVCAPGQTVNCPTIALPIVNSKNFMESVTLNPGQTVIFSGFQDVDNQIGITSMAAPEWWALGGNKAALATKVTTVTVITPYIIGR